MLNESVQYSQFLHTHTNKALVWIHVCFYVQPYPDGWNLPGGGAQRGNVLNLNGAGDPLTPGYPAKGMREDTRSIFLLQTTVSFWQIIATDSDLKMESDFQTFLCIQLVTMTQFTSLSKCFSVFSVSLCWRVLFTAPVGYTVSLAEQHSSGWSHWSSLGYRHASVGPS